MGGHLLCLAEGGAGRLLLLRQRRGWLRGAGRAPATADDDGGISDADTELGRGRHLREGGGPLGDQGRKPVQGQGLPGRCAHGGRTLAQRGRDSGAGRRPDRAVRNRGRPRRQDQGDRRDRYLLAGRSAVDGDRYQFARVARATRSGTRARKRAPREARSQQPARARGSRPRRQDRRAFGLRRETEQNILKAIEQDRTTEKRVKISVAEQAARSLEEYLNGIEGVDEAIVAGSYKRRQETVGDLDAVASSKKNKEVMGRFVEFEDVQEVLSKGEERTSVMLRSGLQVDLRVVSEKGFGTALRTRGSEQYRHLLRRRGEPPHDR